MQMFSDVGGNEPHRRVKTQQKIVLFIICSLSRLKRANKKTSKKLPIFIVQNIQI